MGKYDTHMSDILIGAGIVTLLYYLMNGEPLGTFFGVLTACILVELLGLDQ